MAIVMRCDSAEQLVRIGEDLAEMLHAGDLLVLSGPLGAGKTTMTQGIGVGLGVRGPITSPTFVIARVHPSLSHGPALIHVDAYRLGGLAEVDDLDLDASLPDSVMVVEWGVGKVEQISTDRLEAQIDRALGESDETRTVTFVGVGERWSQVDLAALGRSR